MAESRSLNGWRGSMCQPEPGFGFALIALRKATLAIPGQLGRVFLNSDWILDLDSECTSAKREMKCI